MGDRVKTCRRCGEVKVLSEFSPKASRCKECRAEQSRLYWQDWRDEQKRQARISLQRLINFPPPRGNQA